MVTVIDMTVFYYKSNGDIYRVSAGDQPINIYFGDHSADMMLMLDSILIPFDDYVLKNPQLFKIDITKSPAILALIPDVQVNTYPVATS